LFIPLIFGIFVIVPPQVYLERVSRSQFVGSLFEFYPHYFDGWYLSIGGSGNFAWMGLHLWYLLFLLLVTLVAQPMLSWLTSASANHKLERLEKVLARPGAILLWALPIVLVELILGNIGIGGWNMGTYPLFFLYGYLLLALPSGIRVVRAHRFAALVMAVVASTALLKSLHGNGPVPYGPYEHWWQAVLQGLSGWSLIVTLVGYACRYLNFTNDLLRYANEAVLPFYILYQTFIVLFGFYVNGVEFNVGLKYALVMLFSLGAILITYEMSCRIDALRFLLGMKPCKQST
jgi:hypothetical protein